MVIGLGVVLASCGQPASEQAESPAAPAPVAEAAAEPAIVSNPLRNAYFGDTHIHTILSFDAYMFGTRRTPDEAYEFAKGAAAGFSPG